MYYHYYFNYFLFKIKFTGVTNWPSEVQLKSDEILDRIKENRKTSHLSSVYESKFRADRMFIAQTWEHTRHTLGAKRKLEVQSPLDESSAPKVIKFSSNLED